MSTLNNSNRFGYTVFVIDMAKQLKEIGVPGHDFLKTRRLENRNGEEAFHINRNAKSAADNLRRLRLSVPLREPGPPADF